MNGTIEQINQWITKLRTISTADLGEGWIQRVGEIEGNLASYLSENYPLLAFPVDGGTVLRGWGGTFWEPEVQGAGGEITPEQGVRLQVKNMRPCHKYTYGDFNKPSARKQSTKKPKCPNCGSSDYSLMPTDFETAKCNDCGKNWDHGIVKGINEPPKLGSMSKKASYYIPEGYKTPTALAPEMKWLWTPDNGPYVFPMYRMYTKNDRGLKIMCLHEKFCSANGLPSHGYSFDRLDRGYVFSDPSKKWIRISVSGASENIDEALEDMVEDIQYSFPDTKEWKFTTTGPDNRVLRPGLEENDVPRGEKLNHTVDWGLYASTRSKELHWVTADMIQPGDILAMSGTFMAVKKATLEGGKVALLGEPGQVRRFNPQDEVNIYKG
jgi:hypothetical protein